MVNPSRLCARLRRIADVRRAAAVPAISLLLVVAAAPEVPVWADVPSVDGLRAPIVRINVQHGDVVIHTWNRETVQVDGNPSVAVTRRTVRPRGGGDRSVLIPQASAQTAHGPVQLPPESFVVSSIPPGPRDVVVVRSVSAANVGTVTVHVPADSAFVFAHAGHGALDVHDYKGGTLLAFVGRGRLTLDDVGGTVFAQTNRGSLVARNSNFDRIRARSLVGNMAFEGCNVRQIQATSVAGSIVYDGGSFQRGLARFESTSGNVAIGTTSNATLGARTTGGGRVFTDLPKGTSVDAHGDAVQASVGNGGPVVNATSASGNVYLYGGSLHEHSALSPAWQPVTQTLDDPQRRSRVPRTIEFPARATPQSASPPSRLGGTPARYHDAPPLRSTANPAETRPASTSPTQIRKSDLKPHAGRQAGRPVSMQRRVRSGHL